MTKVSVVGLGKLGACMAASIASKGFGVVGVDLNPSTVKLINKGKAPVFEPGLAEMIAKNKGRLTATGEFGEAIQLTDITFIVVPTPSETHGGFSLRHVLPAARHIGQSLKEKRDYHLVVLTSTVLPGATDSEVRPLLESESGKKCGEGFGLCYGPEFIALGTVLRDFLNPDFLLIGESDPRAGDTLTALYQGVCENNPPIARMNLVNAELAKIAVNTYVTMKITFANTLGALCEKLSGANVDIVAAAVGLDKRIGSKYLKGALGYGGPCFPRDNVALAYVARNLAETAMLAEATDAYNRTIVPRVVQKVRALVPPAGKVSVLGLSYKPGTNVVEESQGLQLASELSEAGLSVRVYDPVAMESARRVLGDRVTYAPTLRQCLSGTDGILIANPDKEFISLKLDDLPRNVVIVDAWRLLPDEISKDSKVRYVALGVGTEVVVARPQMLGVPKSLS